MTQRKKLWFDVGFKRYTTQVAMRKHTLCCGLMQDSKDIQQNADTNAKVGGCGLMQDSKDIQQSPDEPI